jgi:hypothetical protein
MLGASALKTEAEPASETSFFEVLTILDDRQSPKRRRLCQGTIFVFIVVAFISVPPQLPSWATVALLPPGCLLTWPPQPILTEGSSSFHLQRDRNFRFYKRDTL